MLSTITVLEGEKERMKKDKDQLESKLHEVNESKKIEEERVNELDKKLVALQQVNMHIHKTPWRFFKTHPAFFFLIDKR